MAAGVGSGTHTLSTPCVPRRGRARHERGAAAPGPALQSEIQADAIPASADLRQTVAGFYGRRRVAERCRITSCFMVSVNGSADRLRPQPVPTPTCSPSAPSRPPNGVSFHCGDPVSRRHALASAPGSTATSSGSSRARRPSARPPPWPPPSRRAPSPSTDRRRRAAPRNAGRCGPIRYDRETCPRSQRGCSRLAAAADRRRIAVIALRGVIGGAVRTGDLVRTLAEARRSAQRAGGPPRDRFPGGQRRRVGGALPRRCAGWPGRSRWWPGSAPPGRPARTSRPAGRAGSWPSRRRSSAPSASSRCGRSRSRRCAASAPPFR